MIDCEAGGIWAGKKEPNRSDLKCSTFAKNVTGPEQSQIHKVAGISSGKPFAVFGAKVMVMQGHQLGR